MENLYANRWLSYKNFYLCSVSHLGYIHIFFQCRHTENFIAQREVIQYLLIKSTLSRTDRFQPGRRAIILCSATEFLATVAAE